MKPIRIHRYLTCILILTVGRCALADTPIAILISSLKAATAASAKQVTVTTVFAKVKTTQTYQQIGPDRLHYVLQNGSQTQELYVIKNSVYVNVNGSWKKLDVSALPLPDIHTQFDKALQDGIVTVSAKGTETVRGRVTTHYEAKILFRDPRTGVRGVSNVWIENSSGLPITERFDGYFGNDVCQMEKILDYDSTVHVDAPI